MNAWFSIVHLRKVMNGAVGRSNSAIFGPNTFHDVYRKQLVIMCFIAV